MEQPFALPESANYPTTQLPKLPPGSHNVQTVIAPSNNSTLGIGQNVSFLFPQSGCLDPSTMVLRFSLNVTTTGNATAGVSSVLGAASYAMLRQLEVRCGSQTIESCNNYREIVHAMLKMKLNTSQRAASAYQLGINMRANDGAQVSQAIDNQNGFSLPATAGTTRISCALPLMSILSEADRLVPLFAMDQIEFNLSAVTNIADMAVGTTGQTVTGVAADNLELVYDSIHLGADYESLVRQMPPFFIRSTIHPSMQQTIPALSGAGNVDLSYSMRLNSIRSIFMVFTASTMTTNRSLDFADPWSKQGDSLSGAYSGGTIGWSIDSINYPQRALDSARNRAGMRAELAQAICSTQHTSEAYNLSLTTKEYSVNKVDGASTVVIPKTFIVGTSTERVTGISNRALNGVSSKNANILTRLTFNGETDAMSATMWCISDAVLVIDPRSKQLIIDT